MTLRTGMSMLVCVCAVEAHSVGAHAGETQPTGERTAVPPGASGGSVVRGVGPGLRMKDLHRVEQFHGDSGGLSTSLSRGPANLEVPNDFSGVYQIPEDADTPYAGWFARASGAMIAVFPRGEYVATEGGMKATMPANTRFFLGSIPLGDGKPRTASTGVVKRQLQMDGRVDTQPGARQGAAKDQRMKPLPDAPLPVTVETAGDAAGVREAMSKLCSDPVYRANRVRELLERAAGVPIAGAGN